ncbi:MAG TPA: methyltransferase domain-containing protein [Paludibacteraceae bacterium]|jgi:ubiquinone/menaquinone biosynthesis C-methylase UbiE|nr:methyltransferase domain-containing protein [Paludibacteraceae bacterium]
MLIENNPNIIADPNSLKLKVASINERYTNLSETTCCLSCGGAINHAGVQPGEVCLDLGSGRGNDVIRMAEEAGENGFAYGIDLSDGMVKKARTNLDKFGVTNAEIIQSEMESLPLNDNSVNVTISNCTINHSSNKEAVWSEVFRVLKPGGRFVVSDIYATAPIADEYRNDPQAVAECWAGAVTRAEYLTMLEETGFTNIKILEESEPYAKGMAEVASFTVYGEKE